MRSTFRLKDKDMKLRETLEFAAAIYSVGESRTVATFHRFVQPTITGKLSEKEVTTLGIRQEQLDSAKDLGTVLDEFDAFMKENVSYSIKHIDRKWKRKSLGLCSCDICR